MPQGCAGRLASLGYQRFRRGAHASWLAGRTRWDTGNPQRWALPVLPVRVPFFGRHP